MVNIPMHWKFFRLVEKHVHMLRIKCLSTTLKCGGVKMCIPRD